MAKIKKGSKPSPVNNRLIAFGGRSVTGNNEVPDNRDMGRSDAYPYFYNDIQLAPQATKG